MNEDNEHESNTPNDSDGCSFPTSGKTPIESKYVPAAVEQADKNDEKIIEQFVENEKKQA